MGWVVRRGPEGLHPGMTRYSLCRKAGWAPGPVWTGAENLALTEIRSLDSLASNQWLYRLSQRFGFRRHTYLLTPWSRVLLEKLTGSAASQEIPRIFGTRRFKSSYTALFR